MYYRGSHGWWVVFLVGAGVARNGAAARPPGLYSLAQCCAGVGGKFVERRSLHLPAAAGAYLRAVATRREALAGWTNEGDLKSSVVQSRPSPQLNSIHYHYSPFRRGYVVILFLEPILCLRLPFIPSRPNNALAAKSRKKY